MQYDTMSTCASLTVATALDDMSKETNRPLEEIRKEVLESKAYECMLNFDSGLWMMGPDYFREYYNKTRNMV